LKNELEYFTPKEVRRIIWAARLGAKGSLNAIDILEEDMQQFMHESRMLRRESCGNSATTPSKSTNTDLEEEDELTGEDLLRTLDKMSAAASPAAAPKAVSGYIDWQTTLSKQRTLYTTDSKDAFLDRE
jgi:hypothetical protein